MIRIEVWPAAAGHKAALIGAVHDERSKTDSKLGMGTGWSGSKDFADRQEAQALLAFVHVLLPASEWQIDVWANIMVSGDSIALHDHVKSHRGGSNEWTGAYYVATPPRTAPIILSMPNGRLPLALREGTLLLFPASIEHEVPAWVFDGERISIAFNARAR